MTDIPSEVEIGEVLDAIAAKGLAPFLADTAIVAELARELHDNLRIPPALTKLLLKQLVPLVLGKAKPAATFVANAGTRKLLSTLRSLPMAKRILDGVLGYIERIDKKAGATRRLGDLVDARMTSENTSPLERYSVSDKGWSKDLPLDLKADLAALASLDDISLSISDLREDLARISAQLSPQPPLSLRTLDLTARTKFTYGARAANLVGREDELQTLSAFLQTPQPMAWWLLGAAGGMGKSRLALEVALRFGYAARTGFLRLPAMFDWSTWQPERPTVMIVDYAETHRHEARDAIVRLSERQDLDFSVRILLLVRNDPRLDRGHRVRTDDSDPLTPWERDFIGYRTSDMVAETTRHGEPLSLAPLDAESVASIVSEFAGRRISAEELAAVQDLDPQHRPLFASFAGDALARGETLRRWSRVDLLASINREQQNFWSAHGVTHKEVALLALATMTGGVDAEYFNRRGLTELEIAPNDIDSARYSSMIGALVSGVYPALEPDILGEFFVLELLASETCSRSSCWVMLSTAQRLAARELANFLARAIADFPEHRLALALFDGLSDTTKEGELRLVILTAFCNGFSATDNIDGMSRCANLLMLTDYGANSSGVLATVHGNLSLARGRQGDIDGAEVEYAKLSDAIAKAEDPSALIALRCAVADDLIIDFSTSKQLGKQSKLYDEFCHLIKRYPERLDVCMTWSRIAYQYAHLLTERKHARFSDAKDVNSHLLALARRLPSEKLIVDRAAKAAFNALHDACFIGEIKNQRGNSLQFADGQYGALLLLLQSHSRNLEVIRQAGKGARTLAEAYERLDRRGKASLIRRRHNETLRAAGLLLEQPSK